MRSGGAPPASHVSWFYDWLDGATYLRYREGPSEGGQGVASENVSVGSLAPLDRDEMLFRWVSARVWLERGVVTWHSLLLANFIGPPGLLLHAATSVLSEARLTS